jgi:hypothetical protein
MSIEISTTQLSSTVKNAFGGTSVSENRIETAWQFPFGINPSQVRQIEESGGTVAHVTPFVELKSNADPAGKAAIRTFRHIGYIPGVGGLFVGTCVFGSPKEGTEQIFGIGTDTNGFFFGYKNTEFGVLHRNGGVDTWIMRNAWSEKHDETWFSPENGNVYEIKYQWLGFGPIVFSVQGPNGEMVKVHIIVTANRGQVPSLKDPSLPLYAEAKNTGGTEGVVLRTSSASGMVEGEAFPEALTTLIAFQYATTIDPGQLQYAFSFNNPYTWKGLDNTAYVQPLTFSIGWESNKVGNVKVGTAGVITGASWQDVNSVFSPLQYDITPTVCLLRMVGRRWTYLSTFLRGLEMSIPTAQDVRDYLEGYGIDTTVLSDSWINKQITREIIPAVEKKTGQSFLSIKEVTEFYNGTGKKTIILNRRHIAEIIRVETSGEPVTVKLEVSKGIIHREIGIFPKGEKNITVTYKYGFTEPPDPVEAAIEKLTAIEALKQVGARTGGGSLGVQAYSRNFGDEGKYTDLIKQIRQDARRNLRPYMTAVVGA